MTTHQLKSLKTGDIIRHKTHSHGIVVTANYGDRVTAVKTYDVANPDEWDLILAANHGGGETSASEPGCSHTDGTHGQTLANPTSRTEL